MISAAFLLVWLVVFRRVFPKIIHVCVRREENLGYIYKLLSWLKVLTNDDVLWWTPFQTLNHFDKLHRALLLSFQTKADSMCNTF